jgi:flagellar biosynthetic protein FliQ
VTCVTRTAEHAVAPGVPFPGASSPAPVPHSPADVSHQLIVDLARNAIMLALMVAGPMLIVALGVGLIVSVIQAVTQIQEQTLSFVPKLVAVGATFLIALPWILQILIKYTTELFRSLPSFVS